MMKYLTLAIVFITFSFSQEIQCWGDNDEGQLGLPEGNFIAISAGDYNTCGIKVSGEVECWGDNDYSQANSPAGNFIALGAGYIHTCGIKVSGQVECWGFNENGEATPPDAIILIWLAPFLNSSRAAFRTADIPSATTDKS